MNAERNNTQPIAMTRITNARIAGFVLLFYIATGIAGMAAFRQATGGGDVVARLASIAQHAPFVRLAAVLSLLTVLEALVLAVALNALTREEDPDLALMALSCRIAEGVINAIPTVAMIALLAVAKRAAGSSPMNAAAANALGDLLLRVQGWTTIVAATAFAVGSMLFAWLFLRARSIPVSLARLGVAASILLVIALPMRLGNLIGGTVSLLIWIPMLLFEIILGLWLLWKGVAPPMTASTS